MLSISEVANKTGVSAYTLRYYEKLGLLPPPSRAQNGVRSYSEGDVKFICFLSTLKKTGMSLEDIQEFVKDGCVWELVDSGAEIAPSLHNRVEILTRHLTHLVQQQREIEAVIALTKEKIGIYQELLGETKESEGL